jgi:hypothetical protein
MEFGFNFAWLVLSLLLSMGWAWSANRTSARHPHRASFLALVILIALLFPVVSISDDLHEDQAKVTSEEPRYKDDLQHRLETARLHVDVVPAVLDLPLTLTPPPEKILYLEEVRGPVASALLAPLGFPPTLHDLPPPSHA